MATLRVFKLTEEAQERGINWDNFEESDIETVEEIEIARNADGELVDDVDEVLIDRGYGDSDVHGSEMI